MEAVRPQFVVSAEGTVTPEPIRRLICECWDPNPDTRPEFIEVIH
jgi:hypothetical protein